MKQFALFFILPTLLLSACSGGSGPDERVTIESVVDAITFRTDEGDLVRLIGVRSPSAGASVECYGKEALQAAESLIGREVRLETEPLLERAQDGAYPRYMWLDVEEAMTEGAEGTEETEVAEVSDGTEVEEEVTEGADGTEVSEVQEVDEINEADEMLTETGSDMPQETVAESDSSSSSGPREILVNEKALEMGTAFPLVSQDMTYGERMLSAARYASATRKGLWGACEVQSRAVPQGTWLFTQPLTDCVIKAKTTDDGRRIYRTPSCSAYAETTVILSEGGQWFCAEDTAQDAGFEPGEDCA